MAERTPETQGLELSTFTRPSRASINARTAESEKSFIVTWVDFHRLEELISELDPVEDGPGEKYSIAEGVFWGLGSAAFLELISALSAVLQLTDTQKSALSSPYQVIITFVIVLAFSVVLALTLRFFRQALQRKAKESIAAGVARVNREMTTIRAACGVPARGTSTHTATKPAPVSAPQSADPGAA